MAEAETLVKTSLMRPKLPLIPDDEFRSTSAALKPRGWLGRSCHGKVRDCSERGGRSHSLIMDTLHPVPWQACYYSRPPSESSERVPFMDGNVWSMVRIPVAEV